MIFYWVEPEDTNPALAWLSITLEGSMVDVFPAPLGPRIATVVPKSAVKETPDTAIFFP